MLGLLLHCSPLYVRREHSVITGRPHHAQVCTRSLEVQAQILFWVWQTPYQLTHLAGPHYLVQIYFKWLHFLISKHSVSAFLYPKLHSLYFHQANTSLSVKVQVKCYLLTKAFPEPSSPNSYNYPEEILITPILTFPVVIITRTIFFSRFFFISSYFPCILWVFLRQRLYLNPLYTSFNTGQCSLHLKILNKDSEIYR